MTALTADRQTRERQLGGSKVPVAADTRIFAGSLVAINASGYLVPVTNTGSASTLKVLGRAAEHVDNRTAVGPGLDGSLSCLVEYGVFLWANLGTDEIDATMLGAEAYAQDDQTVAATSDGGDRPIAGRIVDVDDAGVWVWHNPIFITIGVGALLAANNLSDVASAATSFGNIKQAATTGATGVVELATNAEVETGTDTARVPPVSGAVHAAKFHTRDQVTYPHVPIDANGTFSIVHSGRAATIKSIKTVVEGATTTGGQDVTVTASIGATPVTDGEVTIAGGSAAGTVDSATPSAANVLADGNVINLAVAQTAQVAAAFATITLELQY
jgi:hypothetical protein